MMVKIGLAKILTMNHLKITNTRKKKFYFVEYKVDLMKTQGNVAFLSMHNLLNADHDGDGMSHFSLKGATDEERSF